MKTGLTRRALACSVFALLSAGFPFGQLLAYHELSPTPGLYTSVAVLNPGPDARLVMSQYSPSSVATGDFVLRQWNAQTNIWSTDELGGGGVVGVADLDGDGHEDILLNGNRARLYSGATRQLLQESLDGRGGFWLGDLDGDGFDELFDGNRLRTTADLDAPLPQLNYNDAFTFPYLHYPGVFTDIAAIGDINGDGIRDVVIGYGNCSMADHGGCNGYHYHNRAIAFSGLDGAQLILTEGPDGYTPQSNFGWGVVALDDLDGDGLPEILITSIRTPPSFSHPRFFVYAGDCYTGGVTPPLMMEVTPIAASLSYRSSPLLVGDVNADGFKDLAVPLTFYQFGSPDQSRARFLDGRTLELLWDLHLPAASTNPSTRPIGEFLAIGDANADSFPDFTAVSRNYGSVWVHSGAPPGTSVLGDGLPGTLGLTPRISVHRPPRPGETSSRFNSTDVSAGAIAVLLLAHERNLQPVAPGVNVLCSSRQIVTSTATVAGRVQATATVDFSNGFRPGDRLFAQWAFLEPTATGMHFATSPILEVVVQE